MIRFDGRTFICEIIKTVVTPLVDKTVIRFNAQSSCDLHTFSMEN